MTLKPEFIEYLLETKETIDLPRSNTLNPTQTNRIVESVRTTLGLSTVDDAWIVISIFVQQGGSAANCNGNLEIEMKGSKYRLAQVRDGFKNVGHKKSLRKFARSNATVIAQICEKLEIEGNLLYKVKRLNPNVVIEKKHTYWVSDFQAYNDDAPEKIRSLIISTFPKKRKNHK